MSDGELLRLLQHNKTTIISNWYKRIAKDYPGFYNFELLMEETSPYFEFLLDLETPLEEHSLFKRIPFICEHLIKREVSVSHIIHSNQLWIDSVLLLLEDHYLGKSIPLNLIRRIIHRVYEYERTILDHYNMILRKRLEKSEQTISSLHEARLTIAGKMAASMAHEIRNPLTTILGFLKLLRNKAALDQTSSLTTYLDIIENEFKNIQMQITGFLSFSKKNANEEPNEKISSNTLIKSVITLITPRLINDNIDFQYIEGIDTELNIQKVAVQQVLSNIVNNSVDALSEVEADKKIMVTGSATKHSYVITVTNNGPEIPDQIKESIFEPFVSSKEDGTGLGLAICKQIMNKNAGDVTYTSNAKETTFFIQFRI